MEVIATALGFHGSLRQPGDKFEVPDTAKASWFKPVDPPVDPPADAKAGKSAKVQKADAKTDSTDLA